MPDLNQLSSLALPDFLEAATAVAEAPDEVPRRQWRGLVQVLASRISGELAQLDGKGVIAALGTYTAVLSAAEHAGGVSHEDTVVRRLNLSAVLLQVLDPSAESALLDPRRIEALFLREVPLGLDQAVEQTPRWRDLEIAAIRRLRGVKNMLTPTLSALRAARAEPTDPRLRAWEALLPDLP
ncbi:hypothetical protein [Actinospica robiniae]|uniref:hypothetical protein n=1 Tax=Actinospica robiniae TaxID=304901 RepID=UPI0004017AB9|nr:hypothetical protein [Actinospica robiniae]